ncbi:1,3-beta-glucanosyltransferase gas1 [Entomortierella chlamydospora]|uniref:Multifunctional fusion protein n=2 Tax=Mortierellaceae TaxID=4854 RepID=A0A9P6T4I5_9FUNG|nr:1,3-beta-glucanosyltransferase gas1 [Entomortierella chlamydospora]
MVRLSTISALALTIACSLGSTWALNTITIKGTKFFDSVTKDQFFIKGAAYQPRSVSGTRPQYHSRLSDLASPKYSIVRDDTEYDIKIWSNVRGTIDASKGYSNILGFFVGNEATNDNKTTVASGYVEALLRDTKSYNTSTASRKIPVGGIDYEWSQEENNYGLVQIKPDSSVTALPNYINLKTAFAPLHPADVKMDTFKEQREISTCPPITSTWGLSTNLPPTPLSPACDCMMPSLSCVASDQAVATAGNLRTLLNTVCSMTSCDDISSNGKPGVYGKYSFCSPAQKLSYVYNLYHVNIGKKAAATCSFNGMAKLSTTSKTSDRACSSIKDTVTPSSGSRSGNGGNSTPISKDAGAALGDDKVMFSLLAVDLLNPSHAHEQKTHKLKRLVQSPNSYFMDVKCPGCVQITTVFSHAQTVVMCSSCANVLAQPTGGITRLTEGCSFRRKQA